MLKSQTGDEAAVEQNGAIKILLTAIGTAATYLWGGWDAVLTALVVLASVDYATGVAAAWVRGDLSSSVGRRGIVRKVGMFVVVALCNIIDGIGGIGEPILRTAATWWYIGNEALSIIENLADIGVPVPERVCAALAKLKGDERA